MTESFNYSIQTNDLICLANIEKRNNIDSVVKSISGNKITIEGEHAPQGYAVVGSEIVKIISSEIVDGTTSINIERRQYETQGIIEIGNHFRTVIILDDYSDITLTSWEYEDSIGSVTSSLFPVELSSGTITMKSDLKLWSPMSTIQKYKVKPRKTIAYIFKGTRGNRILKFTTVVSKVRFNTRGKSEPNKIILDIKSKLAQWYDKDVAINKQLKGTTPKEFFKMAFSLNDNEIYYADGVLEDSFPKINNLHTKEYKTMSELLKAYCQNGIRFCFDSLERVKIFGDFNVDNINSERVLDYDITDSMISENEQMIYNTINTQSVQRQTLYNFEDLDNKYVKFFKVKRNAINSNKMLGIAENGDITIKTLEIIDEDLHSSVQLKDYVLLKRTVAPFEEFYAMVIAIESENKVIVTPILYDKDFRLFNYGKNTYLQTLLVTQSCPMDLYYVREELPMVFKLTRNKNGEEIDSSLMMPLLPRVDGETKYQNEINCTFGSASNLKVGSYTGIVEEVDNIYGTWDSSKLLYNMELTQFSNTEYPPIFALSNKLNERLTSENVPILNYTTFDNSDLLVEITRPSDNSCDAVLKLSNTKNVNSDIDLYISKEIGRFGNKILQVEELEPYKLGDVLIVNKPDDLTSQEETEFDEVLANIRWTIMAKETQVGNDGTRKHYIYVDSNFAKRQQSGKVYEFTKFPNESVVFLQELYFRGNPVIEFSQDIVGMSKGVNVDRDTSREIYGEKKYELDSKQLNKENLKLLMGYILEHFQAITPQTTKFNVPISVFNALDINLLDVVKVNDPIYTQIKNDMKWVVVGVDCKSGTNEVKLSLLNVNHKNTEPYKIDIKDVIEYQPVDIPKYDHAGGEGNTEDNNDGTGGTDVDKSLGEFWLSEVPVEKFRARVEKFEGNYIYFKDFNGEEYEQYQSKLFPVDEFAVNIKGEVIFVQSDMNFRAFIKKRRVYDTEEVLIAPEDDVKFLVTTTYVDVDGTFFGRKMMMGDGDNYLSVDPIKGVKIVGDFVVGENNKNDGNDLWEALNKNKTFQQNTAPQSTPSYTLRVGDIWYDIDDENHCYRYNGNVWVSARDGSIVSTKNTVFIQPDKPQDKDGRPLVDGDTWYDSDDGNKPYVYKGGKWTNVTDLGLQDAIDRVQEQANESTQKLEDIANDNKITPDEKTQVSQEWETIKGEYPKIKNEAVKFGITPTDYNLRYDTLNGYITPILSNMLETTAINRTQFKANFVNYYNSRQDLLNQINTKIKESAVNDSKDYADKVIDALDKNLTEQIDGKINSYNQTNDPSLSWNTEDKQKNIGDLWYNPSLKITQRWNGTEWEEIEATDSTAQAIAESKRTVFTVQPTTPYKVGDLWVTNLSSSGDLKVCKIARANGDFVSSDWVIATKYTDDTRANEAINNAQKAQEDADEANAKLSDISNDNKLTPDEKSSSKKEWEEIKSEYNTNLSQAQLYGVSYTDYTAKYNSLSTYITPLLSNLNTTSDIVGNTFRQKFKDYYDSRQNLLNDISAKAKELADKAQEDATTALGNSKIFYQNDPPTSGMKENDLWYDTNDQNHPYIYKNGKWTSARDKIFETEGGNKVYFQSTQPPTSGTGVKEGDTWFDTAHNNAQYVLIKQTNGSLKWILASDANDKIENGKIVINGNTVFNGDATIVSQGKDETTIIQGGSITFTRGGKPITVIRNMKFGEIETNSEGKGILSFPDFKNMSLLLSIKSFSISQNVRSLGCYANLINLSENKYQFFIYGTESTVGQGENWESTYNSMSSTYSKDNIVSISTSIAHITTNGIRTLGELNLGSWSNHITPGTAEVYSRYFNNINYHPTIMIKVYRISSKETILVKSITQTMNVHVLSTSLGSITSHMTTKYYLKATVGISLDNNVTINDSYSSTTKGTLGYKIEASLGKTTLNYGTGSNIATFNIPSNLMLSNLKLQGTYSEEAIVNLVGNGTLFYLAMEE